MPLLQSDLTNELKVKWRYTSFIPSLPFSLRRDITVCVYSFKKKWYCRYKVVVKRIASQTAVERSYISHVATVTAAILSEFLFLFIVELSREQRIVNVLLNRFTS